MMRITLRITGELHRRLKNHLFPGDGKEAVAFVLCGRRSAKGEEGLLAREIIEVPYAACPVRTAYQVTWTTELIPDLFARARKGGFSVVKIHSHPTGYDTFSDTDDTSDSQFFSAVDSWLAQEGLHASAVMLPDGEMFGRARRRDGSLCEIARIALVSDDLVYWDSQLPLKAVPDQAIRIVQAFGSDTYQRLKRLKIAVIGCSGTGSLVIELLARNCVGELVLVDPERIEKKNLNRIPQATMADARNRRLKVDVLQRAIKKMGLGTEVRSLAKDLSDPAAIRAVAGCDVAFGCMDSVDGRHLLNRLSTFYLIPYFDVGVKLLADGAGGIDQICGSVHYLLPGGSSLLSRGVYTLDQVQAASLYRADPTAYEEQFRRGYIEGVHEENPAVMSVNMIYAALAVNELLARIHPYRLDENSEFNQHTLSLSNGLYVHGEHPHPCVLLASHVGRGDTKPLLLMPGLSDLREEM